jgi:hypothetical protein
MYVKAPSGLQSTWVDFIGSKGIFDRYPQGYVKLGTFLEYQIQITGILERAKGASEDSNEI